MSIIDDLNFALPGLQEMAAPISDALNPIIVLPAHVQGSPWDAVQIGPCKVNGETPVYHAISPVIRFYHFSDTTRTPSLEFEVAIIDAVEWLFEIPAVSAEEFNLTPGLWSWLIMETAGEVVAATGQLTVRHAV